jgi:hypothetical protein
MFLTGYKTKYVHLNNMHTKIDPLLAIAVMHRCCVPTSVMSHIHRSMLTAQTLAFLSHFPPVHVICEIAK